MAPRSRGEGKTPHRTIRVEDYLWNPFEDARQRAGAPDRSTVLREFIEWYTHQPGAKMPKRPTAPSESGTDNA